MGDGLGRSMDWGDGFSTGGEGVDYDSYRRNIFLCYISFNRSFFLRLNDWRRNPCNDR
jgi:hypothetical protein